ncbi:TadE/TadG family type IV pilus assembly protein [Vibrio fluminensis]|uniref:TadE/TadG family type IV pilus assembly protein n=1 Tax=Vibrio fluminensis TaxID=2783614 RepID=UPI001888ED41|nr:TadE family protein [Vibrio fluminensis]
MKTCRKQTGAVAIEFVMGFMLFWWLCMAWVETSYMSYISAVSDLAVSEASRETRLDNSIGKNQTYAQRFQQALKNGDSLWSKFVDPSKIRFTIQYVKTPSELEQLADDYCPLAEGETTNECGTAEHSSIAVYRINYDYQPMFNYFLNSSQLFSREVIMIQEYERDEFIY